MKKSRFLISLSAMLLLAACGGSQESPTSSLVPEPSSSETPSSPSTSSESSTTSGSSTSGWSEEDLEGMELMFDPLSDFVLPFPNGFTSSYVNTTIDYIDSGYYYFAVGDYECGDLTDSYGAQLEAMGLVNFGSTDDYYSYFGLVYTVYQYCIPDSLEAITVELDYYDGSQEGYEEYFEILAWYGEDSGTYFDDAFPYNRIEKELGVTNASSAIPSFSTLEEDGYMSYYYGNQFAVTGTYDASSADEATLYSDYKADLVTLGYTVEDDADYENLGYATNATLGYEIEIDLYEGVFGIFITYNGSSSGGETTKGNDVSGTGSTPVEGTSKINLTSTSFPSQYPTEEAELTSGGITFGYSSVMNSSSMIQFRSESRGSGYLWNKNSLGTINSIEIVADVDEYYGILSLYLSDSAITSTEGLDYVVPVQTSNGLVYNINGSYSYFYLIDEQTYASKNTSITINYTIA